MYHGKGHTLEGIHAMTVPTMLWHVKKLHEQLKGEKEAIEAQHRGMKKRR